MEAKMTENEIIDYLAELQLSFPVVAPRLLMNLELDKDPFLGFDTPVLKTMAKFQVPFLLDSYVRIGAFAKDSSMKSGYKAIITHRVKRQDSSVDPSKIKEQKAEYLKSQANIITERITEGYPNSMAAANFVLTSQKFEEVTLKIARIIDELRSEPPGDNVHGVRLMFCSLMEKK